MPYFKPKKWRMFLLVLVVTCIVKHAPSLFIITPTFFFISKYQSFVHSLRGQWEMKKMKMRPICVATKKTTPSLLIKSKNNLQQVTGIYIIDKVPTHIYSCPPIQIWIRIRCVFEGKCLPKSLISVLKYAFKMKHCFSLDNFQSRPTFIHSCRFLLG